MSDLESRTPRRVREQRAYRYGLAGAGFGAVAVITLVLAIVGIGSLGFPVLAAIVAVVCLLMFRRTVGG